jgi:hypothetical protein
MNRISHLTAEEAEDLNASRRSDAQERYDLTERAAGSLYMSDAEARLRAQAHSEATRHGVVNHREIEAHTKRILDHMAPVLGSLTGPEALELRKAQVQTPLSAAASAERLSEFVDGLRTPIYGTKEAIETRASAAKQVLHKNPTLRQALNTGNAANSVPLGRSLIRGVWAQGKR